MKCSALLSKLMRAADCVRFFVVRYMKVDYLTAKAAHISLVYNLKYQNGALLSPFNAILHAKIFIVFRRYFGGSVYKVSYHCLGLEKLPWL